MKLALKIYGLFLYLLPRELRGRFGPEMLDLIERRLRKAPRSRARLVVFVRGVGDVVAQAVVSRTRREKASGGARGSQWLDDLGRDLKIGVRGLSKRPGFTLVAVLTLALGIGATTTIFSVVDGVLLRPLTYEEPDRLMMIWETSASSTQGRPSLPNFADWNSDGRVFESMAAYVMGNANLTGGDAAERLNRARVTEDLFAVLRASPALGRVFAPDEHREGRHLVALLHHDLWQRRYGGDPAILGRDIELNGELFTIVGVMPPEFRFPTGADVWTPLALDPAQEDRQQHYLLAIGRLIPGVTLVQAQADMTDVSARMALAHAELSGRGSRVVPLQEQIVRNSRPTLVLLMGSVGLVLLIVCANVASLLFVRSASRGREVAIRTAVGADRGRLIRQFLTESALLALLGGTLGVAASYWGVDALRGLSASSVPLLYRVELDLRILGFALLLTIATGVLSGLMPALGASGKGAGPDIPTSDRTPGLSRIRQRGGLIAAEVALALMLLVGAGLLVESFVRLSQVDSGFNAEELLTMRIGLSAAEYPEGRQTSDFYTRLLEELGTLPGVDGAAAVSDLPIGVGYAGLYIAKPGEPITRPEGQSSALYHVVTPGYHEVMGIPLIRGRYLGEEDRATTPFAVLITESMASTYWPDDDPLGQQLQIEFPNEFGTIVGIVGDVRQGGLSRADRPTMYFAQAQIAEHPGLADVTDFMWRELAIVLRTSGAVAGVTNAAQTRVHELDPRLPVYSVQTMATLRGQTMSSARFTTTLLGMFAGVAALLAAIGIYGVVSYTVTGRRPEIGVRLALGATPESVVRTFVVRGMRPVGVGIAIGLVAAAGFTRLLSSLLFGVSALNLPTYVAVTALLAGCALLACLMPATRAAHVDPMSALHLK